MVKVGWVKADTKAIQAIGRNIVTYNTRVSVDNTPGSPTWKLVIKVYTLSITLLYHFKQNFF